MNGIEKAVKKFNTQKALADHLQVSAMCICKWVGAGEVTGKRVLYVEKMTGINRTELNPSIYPPKEAA